MDYTFFYSRVSTVGQNTNHQIENFKSFQEFNSDNLFVDRIQGNVPFLSRPEASKLFDEMTSFSKSSNVKLVIDSIDRLGRSLIDILTTVKLFTQNGINL